MNLIDYKSNCFLEYILFVNNYEKMMKVDNIVLYKDLNGLCNRGILVPDSGSLHGHLEFR